MIEVLLLLLRVSLVLAGSLVLAVAGTIFILACEEERKERRER